MLMFRENHQTVIEMSQMPLEREDLPRYDELAPMAQMVIGLFAAFGATKG